MDRYGFSHDNITPCSWPSPLCSECTNENVTEVWYCGACDRLYCNTCWPSACANRKHEKSKPDDAAVVYKTLRIVNDNLDIPAEVLRDSPGPRFDHRIDEENMWIGVTRTEKEGCMLTEGPAYEDNFLESLEPCGGTTYPGIVSFVGETGAGKSALINLLIKFSTSIWSHLPAAPIVSTATCRNSTSSDVHLYADPDTLSSETPILYADCEGIGGDENPVAIRERRDAGDSGEQDAMCARRRTQMVIWKEITEPLTRKLIAKTLFPRILYIFSDVVIYVQENWRRQQDMLQNLLEWAHDAMEQAYNKPLLPSAIIVSMNKSGAVEAKFYDVDTATHQFLNGLQDVRKLPQLTRFVDYWEETGQRIDTVERLLKCYYATVRVVGFPNQTKPTRIQKQTAKLYAEITQACKKSQADREQVWMKLNATELPLYVRKALTHFASSYRRPFDFYETWFELHPISANLEGGLLAMAKHARDVSNYEMRGMDLWKELSGFIASCILLYCARNGIPLRQALLSHRKHNLLTQCESAAEAYWNKYWPCQYVHPVWGHCANGPMPHKHHQGQYESGKEGPGMAIGNHQPSHTSAQLKEELYDLLKKSLDELLKEIEAMDSKGAHGDLDKVFNIHRKKTNYMYRRLGSPGSFINHANCFSCLDGVPEHCLPCGHAICGPCIAISGENIGGGFIQLQRCPLQDHDKEMWKEGWIGPLKPDQAGIRILTLDGGGIKGIVELEILKGIQEHLGGVPLREFFDLIVGTSAGGIIACGLGICNLDVEECSKQFEMLSKAAFTAHTLAKLPIFGEFWKKVITFINLAAYKTKPLEDAFKRAFPPDHRLFGGRSPAGSVPIKVALTTTTRQNQVVVLANYNRKQPQKTFYDFYRPDPQNEMSIWEAARATSAAPTYFTPFAHMKSQEVYLDGGLYHNNPIKIAESECKALWPKTKFRHPDILLSIGAGFHLAAHSTPSVPTSAALQEHSFSAENLVDSTMTWKSEDPGFLRFVTSIAYGHLMRGMDCERVWQEWLQTIEPEGGAERRYRRLNPQLPQKVEMDDTTDEGIRSCQDAAREFMRTTDIRSIAASLIN